MLRVHYGVYNPRAMCVKLHENCLHVKNCDFSILYFDNDPVDGRYGKSYLRVYYRLCSALDHIASEVNNAKMYENVRNQALVEISHDQVSENVWIKTYNSKTQEKMKNEPGINDCLNEHVCVIKKKNKDTGCQKSSGMSLDYEVNRFITLQNRYSSLSVDSENNDICKTDQQQIDLEPNVSEETKLAVLDGGISLLNTTDTVRQISSSPGGHTVQSHKVRMKHNCPSIGGSTSTVTQTPATDWVMYDDSCDSKKKIKKRKNGNNKRKPMLIGVANARSIRNKATVLNHYVHEMDLDLFFITEAWLFDGNKNDLKIIGDFKEGGYTYKSENRNSRQGGSVGILHKEELAVKKLTPPMISMNKDKPTQIKTMEIMECMLTTKQKKVRFVCIYRPEPSPVHRYSLSEFHEEFSELLAHYNLCKEEIVLVGDYNFHVNHPDEEKPKAFLDVLAMHNMKQLVSEPTHILGNTLDLIIVRKDSNIILDHKVDEQISDHFSVIMELNQSKPACPRKTVLNRKFKSINMEVFKNDLKESMGKVNRTDSLEVLLKSYNDEFTSLLDKHAPVSQREVLCRKPNPWFKDDIKIEKLERRRLERRKNLTKLTVDIEAYKRQKNKVNEMIIQHKSDYYSKLIEEKKENPRSLFKIINDTLHTKENTPLPPHESENELADKFNNYFSDKIENIRTDLDSQNIMHEEIGENKKYQTTLKEFRLLSEDDVRDLVKKAPNKYCILDPVPTWLLRDCLEEVLPVLTKIINLSLQLGDVCDSLKHAIIKPLLKKMGLELIEKNYRPVSNLTYISKLIERAVAHQLLEHLKENKLMDAYQSAYRMFHSTETALLRVRNDLLMEMDKRNVSMLVLLDLSAAFDTIDHKILLKRLSERCGIKDTALSWFASYISNRTQAVQINNSYSAKKPLKFGVPQGSVLGPILFTLYSSPLSDEVEGNLKYHCFADDTQLYLGFSPTSHDNQKNAKELMENCIRKIRNFMTRNKLKLNDDKTEFMIIGTSYWLSKVEFDNIIIGNTEIKAVNEARNLGIVFDKEMKLDAHINKVCKIGFQNVKNLAAIRKILDMKSAKTAAHAFVTSNLDYGNSLLYGVPKAQINKLQLVHNAAAKIVVKKRKFDHISEDMKDMHWLPIEARIKYKLLLLTWKCLNRLAPDYLSELLNYTEDIHERRLNYQGILYPPKTKLITCGDRAFQRSAPELWNKLPSEIRKISKIDTFKKKLKTHLFKEYYD